MLVAAGDRGCTKADRKLSFAPQPRRFYEKPSYPIPVWNGLFEHCSRIGEAIWEFLWCVDAITKEHEGVGIVHGGAPVKVERIAHDLGGRDPETVRRHLKKLASEKYIRARRTPYGKVIEVLNSRKLGIWRRKENPQNTGSLPRENHISGGEIHTSEGEIHTSEGEKPQIAVCNKDTAVTQQKDTTKPAPFGTETDSRSETRKAEQWHGAGPSPLQKHILKKLRTIGREKDLSALGQSRNPAHAHLEDGVFRKRVSGAYFDSTRAGLGHRRAVREAVHEAALDLATNRSGELRGVTVEAIEYSVRERIEPYIDPWGGIGNFDTRVRMMLGPIVRVTAEEALRLRGNLPKTPSNAPAQPVDFAPAPRAADDVRQTLVSGATA